MNEPVSAASAAPAASSAPSALSAPSTSGDPHEVHAVAQRYARRSLADAEGEHLDRYSAVRPEVWCTLQERQRALLRGFARREDPQAMSVWSLVEVGCGSGGNLLDLVRWGFSPEQLMGLELLPERAEQARRVLPVGVQLWQGDATQAPVARASQDWVLQATVFSSLLDDRFQQQLAQSMWSWLRPGGAVIWYDFTVNNPRNPDVRGVPLRRVQALFPEAQLSHERLTLVPPLARALCRVHPALYPVFNSLPLLRTHVLAWLQKPA